MIPIEIAGNMKEVRKKVRAFLRGEFFMQTLLPDGRAVNRQKLKNGVCTAGINRMLDVMFGSGTQLTSWFLLIINNASFTSLAAADTLASHGGWLEWTSYGGNRPTWTPGAAASGSITNPSLASATMNAAGTIRGLGLCSVNSGTAGILYSTAALPSGRAVADTEVLQLGYTSSITPA